MLILPIAEDFDELLEDRRVAAIASLSELRRVMEMAVHLCLVLIIAVLGAKDCRADGAREMFNVVFAVQRGDVRSAKGATTRVAKEIQPAKIVCFAERVLSVSVFSVNGEKL